MTKPLTTLQFIEKSKLKFGNRFDYSKTEYVNHNTNVCIICPKHGEFWQLPSVHLKGSGCPLCGKEMKVRKLTGNSQTFIEKAKKIHGDKYDYSKVEYVNAKTKVCIICSEHGEFWQRPCEHLSKNGCPECANIIRKHSRRKLKTTEEFIIECTKKYGDRYDFSKTIYNGANKPIVVFDKIKKCEFTTRPTSLLTKDYSTKTRINKENFVEKAIAIHGDKYVYDNTEYINTATKISYVCPKHGVIEQLPLNHLRYGCRYCSREIMSAKASSNVEEFIKKAKMIHGEQYDYSKVNYINNHTKVCIICPEHGEFWQTPSKHLIGNGCPKCKRSYLEKELSLFLDANHIEYIEQYTKPFLKNGRGVQKLDFYLPKYNIAIECQGIQHFLDVFYINSKKTNSNIKRDIAKYNKCKSNGIPILYYTTKENFSLRGKCNIYTDENIFSDKSLLVDKIKELVSK